MTVSNTIKAMGGIVRSISPMKAEIELSNGLTKGDVIRAIQRAGYNVTSETL
jgi:hypothetical protein